MARGRKCHGRWAATQGELVFGQAVFLPSPRPPPLARFVNPQLGPALAARIQDGDLITNSGFLDHSTACEQAIVNPDLIFSLHAPCHLAGLKVKYIK